MELPEVVKGLTEFKTQLDKAWFKLKFYPCSAFLDDLNFISQVFAAKVSISATEEKINENKKAAETS